MRESNPRPGYKSLQLSHAFLFVISGQQVIQANLTIYIPKLSLDVSGYVKLSLT